MIKKMFKWMACASLFFAALSHADDWHYNCHLVTNNCGISPEVGDDCDYAVPPVILGPHVLHVVGGGIVSSPTNPCIGGYASLCAWANAYNTGSGYGGWGPVISANPGDCYLTEPEVPQAHSCPAPFLEKNKTPCPTGYETATVNFDDGSTKNCCKKIPCSTCPSPCVPVTYGSIPPLEPANFCLNTTSFEIAACGSCPANPPTPTCADNALTCVAETIEVGCY